MNLQRFVIFLAAIFFFLYGLAFSILSVEMALLVTESKPQGASALIDFRATYGGMTMAVGLALFYLYSIHQIRACLVIVILLLMGMALTRTIGLVVEGEGNTFMYLYLVLELLGSAIAFYAMRRRSSDA